MVATTRRGRIWPMRSDREHDIHLVEGAYHPSRDPHGGPGHLGPTGYPDVADRECPMSHDEHIPEPRTAAAGGKIAPPIEEGLRAFRRDLGTLLREAPGQWVAYRGGD